MCLILSLIQDRRSLILGQLCDLGMQGLVLMASIVGWVMDEFVGAEHFLVFGSGWFSWMSSWPRRTSDAWSGEILGGSFKDSL